jgi:hypothetical protein
MLCLIAIKVVAGRPFEIAGYSRMKVRSYFFDMDQIASVVFEDDSCSFDIDQDRSRCPAAARLAIVPKFQRREADLLPIFRQPPIIASNRRAPIDRQSCRCN